MVHHCILHRDSVHGVRVHGEWRCQSRRVCPGPASAALPMCSLQGAATYGYWYGRHDSVRHPHTYTQAEQGTTGTTSCWAQTGAEHWRLKKPIVFTDLYPRTDWRVSEVVTLSVPDTKLSSHTTAEIVDDFIFLLCFLLQCGRLNPAARDRVHKDGAWFFSVCLRSACSMEAEGWRFGPRGGKADRMRLGSQSLWCYCWQRSESLRKGPATRQHQLPPRNTRTTTLWATQVLMLRSHFLLTLSMCCLFVTSLGCLSCTEPSVKLAEFIFTT